MLRVALVLGEGKKTDRVGSCVVCTSNFVRQAEMIFLRVKLTSLCLVCLRCGGAEIVPAETELHRGVPIASLIHPLKTLMKYMFEVLILVYDDTFNQANLELCSSDVLIYTNVPEAVARIDDISRPDSKPSIHINTSEDKLALIS